jgi:predicted nucleic acid-binding Zn ribbon protein
MSNTRTCSKECALKLRRERVRRWRNGRPEEQKQQVRVKANAKRLVGTIECRLCNTSFSPRTHDQKFCSAKCGYAARRSPASTTQPTVPTPEWIAQDEQHWRLPSCRAREQRFADILKAYGLPADENLAACQLRIPVDALCKRLERNPKKLLDPLRRYWPRVHTRPVKVNLN